jgi:hypothetical protein
MLSRDDLNDALLPLPTLPFKADELLSRVTLGFRELSLATMQ